jgi:hypothetical protein
VVLSNIQYVAQTISISYLGNLGTRPAICNKAQGFHAKSKSDHATIIGLGGLMLNAVEKNCKHDQLHGYLEIPN